MLERIAQHWPAWLAATISYPLAGIAGRLVAGPATAWTSALLAGAVAGLVVGGAPALAMSPRRPDLRWPAVTAVGAAIGLAVSVTLGFAPLPTGLLMGALIGIGQASVAFAGSSVATRAIVAWPAVIAAAWALGWSVTTAIGVDPAAGWAVFGLSGALTSQIVSLAGAFAVAGRPARVAA